MNPEGECWIEFDFGELQEPQASRYDRTEVSSQVGLTRDYRETIKARADREPEYREALKSAGLSNLLEE